jgi:hypothetical protein
MPLLLLEDSQSIIGDAKILTKVTCNYSEQFAEPTLTLEDHQLQQKANLYLLSNTISKLSAANSSFLEDTPSLLELTKIVQMLHNNKSPGADGLTSEVFKA